MQRCRRGWWTVAVALALLATSTSQATTQSDVFCSRTQVQETSVRQQLLDTGQVMVSTQVLTSLRVGETVCISASLPSPPRPTDPAEGPASTASHADPSEPNETRLLNLMRESRDTASPDIPDGQQSESSLESASLEGDASGEQGSDSDRNSDSSSLSADASTGWPADSELTDGRSDGDRRQERAARLPDTISDGETRLSRLLLPSAMVQTRPEAAPSVADDELPRLRIQLTLESIRHQHAISAAYTFSEPRMSVTCTCACASFHVCASCGPLCVSKPSSSPAPDCEGSFLGSARTCCQLKLRPGQPFQAVRLGPAAVFLRLRVAVTELGGGLQPRTEQQTVEASLGDEVRLDLNATRLRISTQDLGGSGARPGWYVLHKGHVYRPQQINELNEWNLSKLGWLKRRGEEHLMPSASRLAAAVDVVTQSCTEQQFQVRGDVLLDSTLPQLGPPLPEVGVLGRSPSHLSLQPPSPGRPVWLALQLQHLQQLHYLVHRASLADFDGTLHVDARSALLAELRLWNASGVQHGSLRVSYGSAGPPPALYRFSVVAERRLQLRLPVALGREQQTARVCLRPQGSAAPPLCRQLPVSRQPQQRLHEDVTSDKQLVVNGRSNPTNTAERFLRALNPATWLQSGGSWTTVVGAVIDIVILIIVISIVWKCVGCCRACCCRSSSKTSA